MKRWNDDRDRWPKRQKPEHAATKGTACPKPAKQWHAFIRYLSQAGPPRPRAIEWLGRLMAMQANKPHDPKQMDGASVATEALARYRGQSCGVKYAEAVRSTTAYPHEIF